MTERLRSEVLQEAEDKLCAIPITQGILGRKIGAARSTLYIVEERSERPMYPVDLDESCFTLFISYFANQRAGNHALDESGTFAHVQACVGQDYAAEQGLSSDESWAIRERADGESNPIHSYFFSALVDNRFRGSETWPNPVDPATRYEAAILRSRG